MSSNKHSCPECLRSFRYPEKAAGKVVKCPACKKPLRLPSSPAPVEFVESTPAAQPEELPRATVPRQVPPASSGVLSSADEIHRLNDLRLQGIISNDEFQTAKDGLLAGAANPSNVSSSANSERQWLVALHLSQFAGILIPLAGAIVPILIWQLKKTDLPAMDTHGKIVANWMITLISFAFATGLIAGFFAFEIIIVPLLTIIAILGIVFPIVGAIKANNSEVWRYPFSIGFFKTAEA